MKDLREVRIFSTYYRGTLNVREETLFDMFFRRDSGSKQKIIKVDKR